VGELGQYLAARAVLAVTDRPAPLALVDDILELEGGS
jgi:hypothetical protein